MRTRAVLRAALALVGMVALVVGAPAALWLAAGWPLPRGVPAAAEVVNAISAGYIPSRFWVGLAATVAWIAWAQLSLAVVVEALSTLVRRETPPLKGVVRPARELARHLVGSLAMVGMLAAPRVVGAHVLPAPATPATAAPAPSAPLPAPASIPATGAPMVVVGVTQPGTERSVEARYVVQPWEQNRDCLWNIAERHLGDGMRWREIYELNRGRPQPGGGSLGDPELIHPGWVLVLPADATDLPIQELPGTQPAAPTEPTPSEPPSTEIPIAPSATAPSVAAPPGSSSADIRAPAISAPVGERPQATSSEGAQAPGVPSEPGAAGPRGAQLVAALAVGLPVFAAGGVIAALNRRRRRQLGRHRPGQGVVRPAAALEPLERRLRALGAEEASAWVDAALRALTAALRADGSMTTPEVVCVRAGTMGLELLLGEPAVVSPGGFVAVDEGHVWRLEAGIELDDLIARGQGHPPATPALVSLGATSEGPVLVNLEALGVLSVEGDDARVRAFLAGAGLELMSAPWAEGVDLRTVGVLGDLGDADGVVGFDDPDELARQLKAAAEGVRGELDSQPSAFAARTACGSEQDWLPTVAVMATPAQSLDALGAASIGGAGVAVVARGPVPATPWRLSVLADGTGRLEPMGLEVRATGVEVPVEIDMSDLDAEAIDGATSLLATAAQEADVVPLAEPIARSALPKQPIPAVVSRPSVWVGVLGPVEVSGWAQSLRERRKLAEVVAYLATHPGQIAGERIRCAAWPDSEVSDHTFIQAMSRLRRHLGSDAEGKRHLPEAVDRTYRLGPGVGCDWLRFQELVRAAEVASASEAIELYRQALDLVRGEPFANVAPGSYVWAFSEGFVYEMEVAIADAAGALAAAALAAEDPDTAEWASRQGRRATPSQLTLFDWDLRAAHCRRDLEGLQRAFKARRQAEQALDPLSGISPDTVELYEGLLADLSDRRVRSDMGS